MTYRVFLFFILAAVTGITHAGPNKKGQKKNPKEIKGLRVLCIGNSYTMGTRGMLGQLAKLNPDMIHFEYEVRGGMTLKRHLENPKLIERIKSGNFDIVVLQEQSQVPSLGGNFQKEFFNAAKELDKHIKAAGGKTAFFVTWGHRDGDKRNKHINPTYEAMQKNLIKGYEECITKLKPIRIPIGPIWAEVKKSDEDCWRKLYSGDGRHPGKWGAYANSLAFFSVLLKKPLSELNTEIKDKKADPKHLELIRKTVEKVVKDSK